MSVSKSLASGRESRLQRLVSADAALYDFFEALEALNRSTDLQAPDGSISVDNLVELLGRVGQKDAFDRKSVIGFLRDIEAVKVGVFIVGRKGYSSRFHSDFDFDSVIAVALGHHNLLRVLAEVRESREPDIRVGVNETTISLHLPPSLSVAQREAMAKAVRELAALMNTLRRG